MRAMRRALLLHGLSSSSSTWWRVRPSLARAGWAVQTMDLRGHGGGPAADGGLTVAALARDLEPVFAGAPLDLVVGHSLGALVALELLARRPGSVRRLVLEEPPGPRTVDFPTVADGLVARAAAARADPGAAMARVRAAFPHWAPADCEHAVRDVIVCDDGAGAELFRSGAPAWDTVGLARHATCPTLVLVAPDGGGRYDEVVDGSALRGADRQDLMDALPDGRLAVLDGGHCLHRDLPDDWLDAVIRFATQTQEAQDTP
jgi:pimeloyl-ACP methyl ester carboxylesterase